jgi:hypothetical protein
MAICTGCAGDLDESLVAEINGEILKSCPSCSRVAGHHVFYRYGEFGTRNMGDGRHIVQSWCPSCRFSEQPALDAFYECFKL